MALSIPSTFLYNLAIFGYVCGLFAYVFNLGLNRAWIRRSATVVVALSFILQTLGMLLRWAEAGFVEVAAMERAIGSSLSGLGYFVVFTQHPPWSNLYEILVYMAWGIVLVFLVAEALWRVRFVGIFALLLTLTALGMASLTDGNIKPLVPALKSWWIMIHVISASIAYASGSIAAVCSLLYLIKAKERVRLSHVCAGVMGVSVVLLLILGRGFELFASGSYKVKAMALFEGQEIVVGSMNDGMFAPLYVVSPYAGWMLLLALLACAFSCFILARSQTDVPQGLAKGSYCVALMLTLACVAWVIANDMRGLSLDAPADLAGSLNVAGPYFLSLKSNVWDLALFVVVVMAQMALFIALLWPAPIRGLLADAARLDRVAYANVMVSFALVAVVLVTGALWAHYAWGRYWGWDPKETGALVIWLTYALYLHTRVTYGWIGPRSAVIAVLGFFVILAGFLGVNLGWFANGLHSYGSA